MAEKQKTLEELMEEENSIKKKIDALIKEQNEKKKNAESIEKKELAKKIEDAYKKCMDDRDAYFVMQDHYIELINKDQEEFTKLKNEFITKYGMFHMTYSTTEKCAKIDLNNDMNRRINMSDINNPILIDTIRWFLRG